MSGRRFSAVLGVMIVAALLPLSTVRVAAAPDLRMPAAPDLRMPAAPDLRMPAAPDRSVNPNIACDGRDKGHIIYMYGLDASNWRVPLRCGVQRADGSGWGGRHIAHRWSWELHERIAFTLADPGDKRVDGTSWTYFRAYGGLVFKVVWEAKIWCETCEDGRKWQGVITAAWVS